jgi:aspartyl-tRNA(Asn)/glutamyl-tRNA(Gln) amidotransferase subunit A
MLPKPRLSGPTLSAVARFAHTPVGAHVAHAVLRRDLGIDDLFALPERYRDFIPLAPTPVQGRAPRSGDDAKLGPPRDRVWSGSSARYQAAYREGRTTPLHVVERALSAARALAEQKPSLGPLMEYADARAYEEAEAATRRFREGRPKGPLDGVLYVVKEEMRARGFRAQGGTTFLDAALAEEDATCVARLREAGAVMLGITPMTEYGMSPVGYNPHRTMPRNPHAPDHVAGGSSTGSGVAVATGLTPIGIGVDGGGSIRVPSAMNGVFGIKPTFGRVSRFGDLAGGSVEHVGPIASSTLDLALFLEAVAAPDARDPVSRDAPPVAEGTFTRALGRGVRGVRIGVLESEWKDADPAIAKACEDALRALEREGAVVVRLASELTPHAPAIGYLELGMQSFAILYPIWVANPECIGGDLQTNLAALRETKARELLDAQRLRAGLRREVARLFQDVDLLAYPTTTKTAARVSDAQMQSGFLDTDAMQSCCRYAFLANLTGLPAATSPVALDPAGLPIGFQLVGDAWDEASVLAAAAHLERMGVANVDRPRHAVDILGALGS